MRIVVLHIFLLLTANSWSQKLELALPLGQFDAIVNVNFSADGQTILTGSADGTAKLWDLEGYALKTFGGEEENAIWTGLAPSGKGVLMRSGDATMRLRAYDGSLLHAFNTGTPNAEVRLAPDCTCEEPLFSAPHLISIKSEIAVYAHNVETGEDKEGAILSPILIAVTPFCSESKNGKPSRQLILCHEPEEWASVQLLDTQGEVVDSIPISEPSYVGFSANSNRILFGSQYADIPVSLWDRSTRTKTPLPDAALPFWGRGFIDPFSPDGQHFITYNQEHEAVMWDLKGKAVLSFGKASLGMSAVRFSPDGQYILMGFENGTAKLFDRKGKVVTHYRNPANTAQAIAALRVCNADSLESLPHRIAIKDDAGLINTWDFQLEKVGTVSTSTDCYDWQEQLRLTKQAQPQSSFVFEGTGQGKVVCKDTLSGQEIATLVVVDSTDWVVTTPGGLFDASPGAMRQLHYVVFYDDVYEVIELEQLKTRYYEPGLLQKLMGFSEDRIRPIADFDTVKLYPKIIDPKINKDQLTLKLKERNGGIGKVSIFINGKEVESEANLLPRSFEGPRYDSTLTFDLMPFQNYLLRDSSNTISIRVYNEEGWLKSRALNLAYQARAPAAKGTGSTESEPRARQRLRPKLYVVCIGTSEYAGDKLDLSYADQDAIMMAQALQLAGQALHRDSVEVHCLSTSPRPMDPALTSSAIYWHDAKKTQVEGIFQAIRQAAKAEDVVVVYLSGHGVTRGGKDETEFYYLTQGVASEDDLSDPATLSAYTISSNELTQWINRIPALKQVLIIDACNSGTVVDNLMGGTKALNSNQIRALDRMKDRTGLFILSGSASNKVSYEASEFGQGLLTYALLEGMRGRNKEDLDVMELFQYARDKVPELAKSVNGIQTPMLGFPRQGASFPIGLLPDSVKAKIPVGNKKPIMIRNIFLNESTFTDDLQIAKKLEKIFVKESQKGADATMIYVDVSSYPDAYSLTGLYDITQEKKITIKLKLLKSGQPIADLNIPPASSVEELVELIESELAFEIE
ncbi:MAG: caspase family protein [Saprospiraceae bacterium]|nr:caspase family protein [Saprospiraceae bacterium]